MESFLSVAQLIALLSASALCIYLIVTLVRLSDVMTRIQQDVSDTAKNLRPVLEHLTVVAEKMRSISTQIDDQVNLFRGSMESMRRIADNIEQFEHRIQQQIEEPISQVLRMVGSILQRFIGMFGPRSTHNQAS